MILSQFLELVPVTLIQGLLFSLVALAIMIPFRFLGFSDISAEGSFPLGGAVCGVLLVHGVDPVAATLVAAVAGASVGFFTGFINQKFKINSLLCGVLVITMLYSIILRLMGKPNISLLDHSTLFSLVGVSEELTAGKIFFLLGILGVVSLKVLFLFQSEFGLRTRAVGSNPLMAQTQGVSIFQHTLFGLALANALSALSGSLVVQSQGYADASMGFGVLINGLASMMLGEFILAPSNLTKQIVAPLIGSVVFYQVTSFALSLGLEPSDMKLISGIFVLMILAFPQLKSGASAYSRRN